MKQVATPTDRFIVHDAVAMEVMAHVAMVVRRGDVQVIDIPVLQDGRRGSASILITPVTQMSISSMDGPELELTETDREAVAALAAGADGSAAVVEEPHGLEAASAFVDFDLYVTTAPTRATSAPSLSPAYGPSNGVRSSSIGVRDVSIRRDGFRSRDTLVKWGS